MNQLVDLNGAESNRRKTRVLVIDDDLCVGAAIRMLLNHAGYNADHVSDPDTAGKLFETARFDLLIVDIFMPGRNGIATIASFRAWAPAIPIVAMSGFRFRSGFDRSLDFLGMAIAAGATASLRKPFTWNQLMAAVSASFGAE